MNKMIYMGEGISKQLRHVTIPNKREPVTSNYFIMGSKMYETIRILYKKEKGGISPELADLKLRALEENAYLYPGWDYLKYSQVDLTPEYCKTFTNESFEEVSEDEYEDPILIFVGREGDL